MYHAQSQYKAGFYDQAAKACLAVEDPQYYHRVRARRKAAAWRCVRAMCAMGWLARWANGHRRRVCGA